MKRQQKVLPLRVFHNTGYAFWLYVYSRDRESPGFLQQRYQQKLLFERCLFKIYFKLYSQIRKLLRFVIEFFYEKPRPGKINPTIVQLLVRLCDNALKNEVIYRLWNDRPDFRAVVIT